MPSAKVMGYHNFSRCLGTHTPMKMPHLAFDEKEETMTLLIKIGAYKGLSEISFFKKMGVEILITQLNR